MTAFFSLFCFSDIKSLRCGHFFSKIFLKTVHSIDICEATHQAATVCFGNTFCLWDLTSGESTRTFDTQKSPIHIIAFNPDGSCIATALSNVKEIKIWCPKTGITLFTFSPDLAVESLAYTRPIPSTLTATYYYDNIITQWALTTHNTKSGQCLNHACIPGRMENSWFSGNIYSAQHPTDHMIASGKILYITKNKCNELFLMKKAIEKIDNQEPLESKKMKNLQTYKKLTSLEKTMLTEELRKRRTALTKTIPEPTYRILASNQWGKC